MAVLRLSTADDAAPAVTRIREGTLRGVSVGYRVASWRESVESGHRIRTAVSWAVFEVSAVPVAADPAASLGARPWSPRTRPKLSSARTSSPRWLSRNAPMALTM
ncbi:HK97 family phage prohead protease [Chenggangzhangella methanolivorans]|uniref:HK97 family phage prohead protease n=1 Tax=Chenggangzhangella methanolivorans TaxID=1437009 RepID=UPI0021BDD47E